MKTVVLAALCLMHVDSCCIKAEDASGDRYVVEREVRGPSVDLTSNTSAQITREINVSLLAAKILGKDVSPLAYRALTTGDMSGGTLWISFPQKEHADSAEISAILEKYVELRRLGISPEGVTNLLRRRHLKDTGEEKYITAMASCVPWLRYDVLKKAMKNEVKTLSLRDPDSSFLFVDSDIVYLVEFRLAGDAVVCSVYALDPKEFDRDLRRPFDEALADARLSVTMLPNGQPESPMEFWSVLKGELVKRHIVWKSPFDLNPTVGWR